MFYPAQFVDKTEAIDQGDLFQAQWKSLSKCFQLDAIFLLKCRPENFYFEVYSAFNVPPEPFNGAEKELLCELVKDCFEKHAKPHIHSLSGSRISERMQKFNRGLSALHRVWFYPLKFSNNYFIFLGFPNATASSTITQEFDEALTVTLYSMGNCIRSNEIFDRLKTTELFVKEIGHDIASSVQAIVAKVCSISEKRVTGDAILRKAKEIEDEMWSAYRVSESLGIVVDPDYKLKEPASFNLVASLETAKTQFVSEAAERHMKLQLETSGVIQVWGDRKAIEQALGHLLSNAIKYGDGDSVIQMSATQRRDDVLIRITNNGNPLPPEPELYYIWDFGYRGNLAKEMHVNGSGIGLYSVKKIANAHHSKVEASSENRKTSFFIHLPIEARLKKELGMLL